ncbi:MAG: hypothetical protein WC943_10165, partial [Elusimicrobiota bacterium]
MGFLASAFLILAALSSSPCPARAEAGPSAVPDALVVVGPGPGAVLSRIEAEISASGGVVVRRVPPCLLTASLPPGLESVLAASGAAVFRGRAGGDAVDERCGGEARAAAATWNRNLSVLSVRKVRPGRRLEVSIETDGKRFKVVSAKAVDRLRRVGYRQRLGTGRYYLEFLDASGKVLYVQSLADPALFHADSLGADGRGEGLSSRRGRRPKARMTASVPLDPALRGVRVSRQSLSAAGAASGPLSGPWLLRDE